MYKAWRALTVFTIRYILTDNELLSLDIIASSGDDFADSLEVFDAVGEILMEGDSTKSEAQARTLIISPAGC